MTIENRDDLLKQREIAQKEILPYSGLRRYRVCCLRFREDLSENARTLQRYARRKRTV